MAGVMPGMSAMGADLLLVPKLQLGNTTVQKLQLRFYRGEGAAPIRGPE